MGNTECFEPLTSNVFTRTTNAGEFVVMNKYLVHDLMQLGVWNSRVENWLKKANGSIQGMEGIPDHIKNKYKTAWELSQKCIIDLAADRAPFVDQSQSMNLHLENIKFATFNSMHMYSWKKGLKTGCYYLRSKEAITPIKFTVDEPVAEVQFVPQPINGPTESCEVCSG